ncbi:ferredoxin reductase-like protein [Meira miltonrushii]|uniref:NADH-cytochrome b5 reductase n=1 Tax=Meira miltonrushii TaxID=1280837 RepID=A0A316VCL2_9BASI|nr:ferredoxin reductase-like protein [Meira miltonrushii]PWN35220.1 ferredoxin reductase-like protein [Meira miltonrushii]
MLVEQFLLLSSTLITFGSLLALLKFILRSFPNQVSRISLLHDLDKSTDIMDPNTILAFIVGLVASIGVLIWINAGKAKPVLNPKEWQSFKLMERKDVSDNTAVYRFRLPSDQSILGLPIGQHISLQANIDGKNVQRSYTPVSSDDERGFFDLMIKTYPNGNISKHMSTLKVGDKMQVKGPKGQMRYSPDLCRRIGMLAGGTGITPMLQIIRAMAKNPKDNTKIDLIYANVKENDILLRKELDDLAEKSPERFTVHYFLNEPPQGWKYGSGFVSKEAIEEKFPKPADDIKILLCGPPPMINAMKKHLDELGYEKPNTISKLHDQVFSF